MFKKLFSIAAAVLVLSSTAGATDVRILEYNNPELTVDLGVGLWGIPIPVDYDNDGLNDILVNCADTPYKGIYFFRNIGTNAEPLFDKAEKLCDKASNNLCVSYCDGKALLIDAGKALPDFFNSFMDNPQPIGFEGGPFIEGNHRNRSNMWNYVDWDNDGDLDIIVGYDTWADYGWDNAFNEKGEWTNGPLRGFVFFLENTGNAYVLRGRIKAGSKDLETFGAPCPCIADFDGDGDLDLICGEFVDGLTWYENIGTREAPVFAEGKQLANASGDIRMHLEMIVPRPFDFDGDGYTDLIIGDEDGRVAFLRNTGKLRKGMPQFDSPVYLRQKADLVKWGALCTPCSFDWDGDGDEDIICGNSSGEIAFIENLSGGDNPVWAEPVPFKAGGSTLRIMAGKNGSIQGPCEAKWGYTVLSVADWDEDGKADIMVNSIWGKIQWYRNTGKGLLDLEKVRDVKVCWEGEAPKPAWNWWKPAKGTLSTQWRTTPVVMDWNGDGINDLIVLDHEGYLAYFEGYMDKGGKAVRPGQRIFYCTNGSVYRNRKGMIDKTPGLLRLNDQAAGSSGRRKICFTDWDNDGKQDLIIDGTNAAWFKNARTKDGKTYFTYMGDLATTRLEGHTTCPTPIDWDNNKIMDLLVGAEDGHFYIIKNPMSNTPSEVIKLYPELGTGSAETIDGKGYIWNITNPEILVFEPAEKKTDIAMLVVPGGGYEKNCITYEGYGTVKWLNENGITAFILKYRLPAGNPDVTLEDGEKALSIIRANAGKYGIDPSKVGIIGFSAGGHFCSTLATKFTSKATRPDFAILVYPVISSRFNNVNTHKLLLGDRLEADGPEWSSENNVRKDMPPVMLLLCSDDKTVPMQQSLDFYQAALGAGADIQIHIFPKGGHGFWMRDRYTFKKETYPMVMSWIKDKNK